MVRRQGVRKAVTKIPSIHERMPRENVRPLKRNKESMTHNKKVDKPNQANSLPSSSDMGMSGVAKNLLCRTDAEKGTIKVIRLDSRLLGRRSMTGDKGANCHGEGIKSCRKWSERKFKRGGK